MAKVTARYRNAKGVVKEITWYMGECAKAEAPADVVDPAGVHWWLEGTEEPELPEVHLDTVMDIEEIMRKYGSNC